VYDRGLFVLKENLKKLKLDMKIWNTEVFKNVNQAREILQKKIQELDARDDEDNLHDFGREERRILLDEHSWNFFKQEAVMRKKNTYKVVKTRRSKY